MIEAIPPVLIGWCGPLVIIIPFTLIFRHWLPWPWRFLAFVYTISILTGIWVDFTKDISDRNSALVAGFYAPLIYCVLFGLLSIFYHYFIRHKVTELDPTAVNTLEKFFLATGGLLSGLLIGGVIGLLIGAIFTFVALAYVNLRLILLLGQYFSDPTIDLILESGTYFFGVLGAIVGGIIGLQNEVGIQK